MVVRESAVFPERIHEVFQKLQQLDTLRYIAAPYARFESLTKDENPIWAAGEQFKFQFYLFGWLNLGVHRIQVVDFRENAIYTNEGNPFCPVWNHRIFLKKIDNNHTAYTDEVEISEGWKTPFVYLWAKRFYRHRQRRWKHILNV